MKTSKPFSKGEFLFRQGDPSDRVLWVRSGEIEILRDIGGTMVPLGNVREGEWLGEMGVIEGRDRSATARAAADCQVDSMTAHEFLDQVSRDPALARQLLLRLSIRLRQTDDKVAKDLVSLVLDRPPAASHETAPGAVFADESVISLVAETEISRARIGSAPIRIGKLPFVVGRIPLMREAEPTNPPDLLIDDEEPFRLSRQHFMIAQNQSGLIVSDLGSTLGTIVNGQPIGHHFMRDAAPLHRGENHVVAGGRGSPFEFKITVQ